jgi:hypothetical protein
VLPKDANSDDNKFILRSSPTGLLKEIVFVIKPYCFLFQKDGPSSVW